MTFLNTSLLFALGAIAIPIALHLLARKEPRKVVFPSVRLLTHRFETNRSKVRMRRWWLLALRIAALATVAFAMARPAISGVLSLTWTTIAIGAMVGVALLALATIASSKSQPKSLVWSLLAGATAALMLSLLWGGYVLASGKKPKIDQSSPVALAIVVDNAPTSGWMNSDQDRLESMRENAIQLLQSANPQSRFAVVDRSATPAAFALDLSSAVSKCNQLAAIEVVSPLASRIEAAARLLATSDLESRQLVLISGLTEDASDTEPQSLQPLLAELGVTLTLWDKGPLKGFNRTLSLPTLSNPSPSPKTSVKVTATLSIDSDALREIEKDQNTKLSTVTAECVLFPSSPALPVVRNGKIVRPEPKPVDRSSVTPTPMQRVQLSMTLPPLPVGLHHGAIRLIGTDALALDDAAYFTVAVLPPSRMLLVGDQQAEANVIRQMITVSEDITQKESQYEVEQIGFDDLAASQIQGFDAVMMLNPPVDALQQPEIASYLDVGGSLFVAAGPRLGEERVEIAAFPTLLRPWRAPDPGTFLEISSPSHPALRTLASIPDGVPFADFRVDQYWQAKDDDSISVLMRYAGTNHPALLQRQFASSAGQPGGRILLLTTPIPELADQSQAWNELFSAPEAWPGFLLVRDIARYLTRRSVDELTLSVGSTVVLNVQPRQTDDLSQPRRLQWFPPVGTIPIPVDVPASSQTTGSGQTVSQRVPLGRAMHSGVHWVRGGQPGLGFTVNARRDYLSTKRVSSDTLDKLFGQDAYRSIKTFDEMDWTGGSDQSALPLWSPIMLIALVVFLLEQILSNRFYRNPNTASPRVPAGSASP